MQKIQIKTYSGKELAGLYNISPKTLRKWLTRRAFPKARRKSFK